MSYLLVCLPYKIWVTLRIQQFKFVCTEVSFNRIMLHLYHVRVSLFPSLGHPWVYFSFTSELSHRSVQFSCSVVSNSLRHHGLQHARLPCPLLTPRACSNSCPSSQWCHPTISSSVVPSSSHLHYFPALGSFPMSQFFTAGGQSIGVSVPASVLPLNIIFRTDFL